MPYHARALLFFAIFSELEKHFGADFSTGEMVALADKIQQYFEGRVDEDANKTRDRQEYPNYYSRDVFDVITSDTPFETVYNEYKHHMHVFDEPLYDQKRFKTKGKNRHFKTLKR